MVDSTIQSKDDSTIHVWVDLGIRFFSVQLKRLFASLNKKSQITDLFHLFHLFHLATPCQCSLHICNRFTSKHPIKANPFFSSDSAFGFEKIVSTFLTKDDMLISNVAIIQPLMSESGNLLYLRNFELYVYRLRDIGRSSH